MTDMTETHTALPYVSEGKPITAGSYYAGVVNPKRNRCSVAWGYTHIWAPERTITKRHVWNFRCAHCGALKYDSSVGVSEWIIE